ncbi:VOC family protein [Actinoplanes awajinensis]|uniref:VOC family protein n=1 Tax=Actinoplanes awajinensis TaxID=135946 RepID=UPI000A043AA2
MTNPLRRCLHVTRGSSVLDCSNLDRSATFWCGVLGYRAEPSSPGRYQQLMPPDGHGVELLLQQVTEAKVTKNRLHLDLRVPDLAVETARVMALGAGRVTENAIEEYGWSWHVFTDPDGNEFCVLQPPKDNGEVQSS